MATVILLTALLAAAAAGVRTLQVTQGRRIAALKSALYAPTPVLPNSTGASASLRALPPPVQRYLELVLPRDIAPPLHACLAQHGQLKTSADGDRWLSFTATHSVSLASPGFMWDATVNVAPLVHVRVLDSLMNGSGSGEVLLMSALGVAGNAGTPEMKAGSMHRYLAEAVWYPWALLPSKRLNWHPVNSRSAIATLEVGDCSVSLEFRFADSGEVLSVHTPGRWGSFSGAFQKVPWEGRFYGYERRNGVMLPRHGEVGWYRRENLALVWRGTVDEVTYQW